MPDFKAQLGRADHPGLASQAVRLRRIVQGRNPYVTGDSLPPDSPVFFGRGRELAETLGVLRRPDKPGSVSVLGERRFGKSSFLNQVYQALGTEQGLVSIHATTQDWDGACPKGFFAGLQQAILGALAGTDHAPAPAPEPSPGAKGKAKAEVADYPGLRDFIRPLAANGLNFVLLLDELEGITGVKAFDADFFANLRALGERHEYRFGYLISSLRPLKELCRDHRIEESKFWNIFGFSHYIGALDAPAAEGLVREPLKASLPKARRPSLEGLWDHEIAPLAGGHPALIQMILHHRWQAWSGGYGHNRDRIDMGLREFLEDLWFNRHGQEEWRVLIQAAHGEPLADDVVLLDLRLRGLITPDGRPFSARFGELIPQLMPEGMTLNQAVDLLKKGGDSAAGVLQSLEKWARTAGKLVRAVKGLDPGLDSSGGQAP